MSENSPLAVERNAFSHWWIIGLVVALFAFIALSALAYIMKKKYDLEKQLHKDNNLKKCERNEGKANEDTAKNVEMQQSSIKTRTRPMALKSMTSNMLPNEEESQTVMTLADAGKY